MTPLTKHTLGAWGLGSLMMTTTLAFSGYSPSVEKSDILNPVLARASAYEPAFRSTIELKENRGASRLMRSDRQKIAVSVIGQLRAFSNGDADTAYALAAPLVRSEFASAETFLRDLSDVYGLISMSKIERLDGLDMQEEQPRQRMILTSPSGRRWIAYFSMQRQNNGDWKVLGFMI